MGVELTRAFICCRRIDESLCRVEDDGSRLEESIAGKRWVTMVTAAVFSVISFMELFSCSLHSVSCMRS